MDSTEVERAGTGVGLGVRGLDCASVDGTDFSCNGDFSAEREASAVGATVWVVAAVVTESAESEVTFSPFDFGFSSERG